MGARAVPVLFAAVVLLVCAPAASACTTDDWVTLSSGTAAAGAPLSVQGGAFEPGVVDLRWNGMEGVSLGSAEVGEDGRFTATVRLPADVAAGRYSLAAVQDPAGGGALRGWAYADVVVPAPPPPPASSAPAGAIAAALLLSTAGVVAALHVRRRRSRDAGFEADLERLLARPQPAVDPAASSRGDVRV
ncbi:MAG: hypothetical protein ACLGIG_08775 [Actinomycetes bacterium]